VGILYAILMGGIAHAGVTAEAVVAARVALVARDVDRANSLLMQARMSIPNEAELVDAALVGELLYLEGLAQRIMGDDRERDLNRFRDALSVYPRQAWAREIIDDKAARAYFEALRSEILQRPAVPTSVPEQRGLLKAYVDGIEHVEMQAVRAGPHVAQVLCPDGAVAGVWTEFDEMVDWIKLCPSIVDLRATPPPLTEDAFEVSAPNPRAGPDPMAWVPPPTEKKSIKFAPISKKTLWIGASVAGAVAVGTYAAALSSRAKYDDLNGIRRAGDLQAQRTTTNRLVGVSIGSALAAGGLAVAASLSGEF
jgi:hypothetical protein